MDSFHRSDWISLSQSIATLIAVAGAYGVVWFQSRIESRREAQVERKSLVRERYRSAAYVEALLSTAISAVDEVLENTNSIKEHGLETFEKIALKPARISMATGLIGSALGGTLPTEVMRAALHGYTAVDDALRIAEHTQEKFGPKVVATIEGLNDARTQLIIARELATDSRQKWESELQE